MTLNNEEKIELLMDGYNLFKNKISQEDADVDNIARRITESIVKMMKIDIALGTEMWESILTSYHRIGKYGNDTHSLTSGLMSYLRNQIEIVKVAGIIQGNSTIKEIIYSKAASPDSHVIGYLIETRDFTQADELLNMVYENKNHDKRIKRNDDIFGEYFYYLVILDCKNIDKEGATFIYTWLDKVVDEEFKASIKIKLIDLL